MQPETKAAPVTTAPLAIVSVVLAVANWLFLPLFGGLGAVITGHLAKRAIARSDGRLGGAGLATVGLVLGYIGLAVHCLAGGAIVAVTFFGPEIRRLLGLG
jgi:hypothetical protein